MNQIPVENRIGGAMVFNYNKFVLLGGQSNRLFSGYEVVPFNKQPVFFENKALQRTNFAKVQLRDHVLIHGGTYKYYGKGKVVLNTIVSFCISSKQVTTVEQFEELPKKKDHIAFFLGKSMYIEGGTDHADQFDSVLYECNF